MRDALSEIQSFILSRRRSELDENRMLLLALVKEIEIVGEAANALSPETLKLAPDVPWVDVIGMRHRMVHAYDDINRDILWRTCTRDAPALLEAVERMLGLLDEASRG
jgi:uncharacterized protein with HEPN domain